MNSTSVGKRRQGIKSALWASVVVLLGISTPVSAERYKFRFEFNGDEMVPKFYKKGGQDWAPVCGPLVDKTPIASPLAKIEVEITSSDARAKHTFQGDKKPGGFKAPRPSGSDGERIDLTYSANGMFKGLGFSGSDSGSYPGLVTANNVIEHEVLSVELPKECGTREECACGGTKTSEEVWSALSAEGVETINDLVRGPVCTYKFTVGGKTYWGYC